VAQLNQGGPSGIILSLLGHNLPLDDLDCFIMSGSL
jgi:hypothetical protein